MDQTMILFLIASLIFLLFIFIFFYWQFKKHQNIVLEKEKQELKTMEVKMNQVLLELQRYQDTQFQHLNQHLFTYFQDYQNNLRTLSEKMARVDEGQKNIQDLSKEITSLQNILSNKQARGLLGEVQLNYLLQAAFGEENPETYQTQYVLSNRSRVDAMVFAPEPLGSIAIDSKFPLETYQKLSALNPQETSYHRYEKQLFNDIKRHIDDISDKYIIENETSGQAMMFVPAEAIFAYIHSEMEDLVQYAYKKKVWIVSPSTLMSTLTTIQAILIGMKRDKFAGQMQEELKLLSIEFERFQIRWNDLSKHLEQVSEDVRKLNITSDKIQKRFENISNLEDKE